MTKKTIRFILAWTILAIFAVGTLVITLTIDAIDWLEDYPSPESFSATRENLGGWWKWASFK